jgi:spore protease
VSDIRITKEDAVAIGKAEGRYVTIETDCVFNGEREKYPMLVNLLASKLKSMTAGKRFLIVGLGNRNIAADALGAKCCENVIVTRGLTKGRFVASFVPGVLGETGIESAESVKGVADEIKPDVVIAVDSLCAASQKRLLASFQLSDSGISPGSGVNNPRKALDEKYLKRKVVCIGVPTVVYASTLGAGIEKDMVVTPKDIDIIVRDCAYVLARAINKRFGNDY